MVVRPWLARLERDGLAAVVSDIPDPSCQKGIFAPSRALPPDLVERVRVECRCRGLS
jgi:hypothetical protein